MKTIAFVATKGGTGKTSLAFALGIEAAKRGSVYFIDVDPQASLTELCKRREVKRGAGQKHMSENQTENPALLTDVASLTNAVASLKRTKFERDFIVADTPGSMMRVIRNAIEAADCLILPVQESPLDVLAQEDAAQYIIEAGRRDAAFFVMNRIDPSSKIDDLTARLGPVFPNPPVRINQRLIYARALIAGKSAAEVDKKAAADIAKLWAAIEAILKKEEVHGYEKGFAGGHAEGNRA
jgi:chromosome partitioning protein